MYWRGFGMVAVFVTNQICKQFQLTCRSSHFNLELLCSEAGWCSTEVYRVGHALFTHLHHTKPGRVKASMTQRFMNNYTNDVLLSLDRFHHQVPGSKLEECEQLL